MLALAQAQLARARRHGPTAVATMTRVLHVVEALTGAHGGPSWTVPSLCGGLVAAGFEVSVATALGDAEAGLTVEARALPAAGVRLLALPRDANALRALVAEQQIVHVNGCWRPLVHRVHVAARQGRIPVVLSPHGTLEPWAIRHKRLKKLVAWHLYQRRDVNAAAVLHATAELERESLVSIGAASPIAVIANPVEIPAASELPFRPPVSGRRRRVLFLSRVHEKKGIELLLEAWSRTRPRGWELVIAGSGEPGYCARLEEQVRRLGLGDEVSFVGHLEGSAKWAQYRASELFVLPSRSENFGLVVAEALAAETPVIATEAAPWRAVAELGCGWSVPVSVEGIAAALEQALALTDAERAEMGAKGRRFVAESFSVAAVASATGDLYRWVLGELAEPPGFVRRSVTETAGGSAGACPTCSRAASREPSDA